MKAHQLKPKRYSPQTANNILTYFVGHESDALDWKKHTGRSDILAGFVATHVWSALGWHDIKQRYRRSVLGPFWFTLSTLIMVAMLGLLYSTLLGQPIAKHLPYIGIGIVVWQFVSTSANEGCSALISSAHLIKQIRMPISIHIWRMAWHNLIIFLHSLPVVIVLMMFFGHSLTWHALLVFPALVLLLLNAVWSGIVFGILCARYRDVAPIVGNFFQVFFFLTPVMWNAEALKSRQWIADFNPFYHIIETIRSPIIGTPIELTSWIVTLTIALFGFIFAQMLMVSFRERISYWV